MNHNGYTPDGSGGYDYVYQFKDHLGNIRLSYTDRSDLIIDDDFSSDKAGWIPNGSVSTELLSG